MRGRLARLTEELAANLWVIPLASFAIAYGMSAAFVAIDRRLDVSSSAWFTYGGSPAGARQLLSTIAGSMITFIGMVFSSTLVVLQLASSQFSPRIMRSFFRDRIIQVTLGVFIATFAYAILILRQIREAPQPVFVPGLATYAAIALVWASLAMFVIYLNHLTQRIRAVSIIETAAADAASTLARFEKRRPERTPFATPHAAPQIVVSRKAGVIGSIDEASLLKLAAGRGAVVEIVPIPGDFVCTGSPLARIWAPRDLDGRACEHVAGTISVERERTSREDVLFGIRQLVDIADKALSPGINDPTTAVQVIDQLHELLHRIAEFGPRSDVYAAPDGTPRLFVPRPTWQHYLDASLEEVLLYGKTSIQVLRRLLALAVDLQQTVPVGYRPPLGLYRERIEAHIASGFEAAAEIAAARRMPRTIALRLDDASLAESLAG